MADFKYCKLEIFIPETHLNALQKALQEADAGHIGSYDCCLSYSHVTGCWRPLKGTTPCPLARFPALITIKQNRAGGQWPFRLGLLPRRRSIPVSL